MVQSIKTYLALAAFVLAEGEGIGQGSVGTVLRALAKTARKPSDALSNSCGRDKLAPKHMGNECRAKAIHPGPQSAG
jgi:hypothetical protein